MCVYMYAHIPLCVCVCVCVYDSSDNVIGPFVSSPVTNYLVVVYVKPVLTVIATDLLLVCVYVCVCVCVCVYS